jgi:uncharacterized membrane protein YGL010W
MRAPFFVTPPVRSGTLAERLLIVPAAHTHIGHLRFQVEMYELFHRTPGGRLGHGLGTPTILFGVLMLVSRAPGPAAPLLAAGLVLGIAAWGAALDRVVGAVTLVLGAALAVGAAASGRAIGDGALVAVGLALVLGGCAVQTFSHLFEDVPPPLSGAKGFVPLPAWLARIGVVAALRAAALTLGIFYWLELWASLRLLPIQVLHLMMRAGFRPELRRALDARVAEILAEPTADWRRPRALGGRR